MNQFVVSDPQDPRIAAFRDIRERDLTGREGLFIAEGEVVVRVLASDASECRPRALLLAEKRVAALADVIAALPDDAPVYVAAQDVLDQIAGFHLHRGILALGEKPPVLSLDAVLGEVRAQDVFVVASGIGNHDNMGGLFRNAAAFGARAVLLDGGCCDPFYRKSIRVSVGAVLRTPFVVMDRAQTITEALQAAGVDVLALTPSATQTLADYRRKGPAAVVLGSEGPGLPRSVIESCTAVGIPMAGGFDSLNVAATSAVALHHLQWASRP
ncbi:tRNA G18 (ribose-2'-O)-methylase SpoU [Brevundimonas nasdae]|uniref:TrmH family RNA methyltransferase n=1 Tax=Brevundimonas nasdae TaxID=172043 RepID=UPI0019120161|nr:RNA methyltransferase [Brevundimonas nasdae]MBK6026035.1 RNA methyltransferase [Brevundimonas nasdae]MDQ0452518.1 tRNA G18 (ribose-2'-O)-methylase SpoU [Brevundimonas nasdae]